MCSAPNPDVADVTSPPPPTIGLRSYVHVIPPGKSTVMAAETVQ